MRRTFALAAVLWVLVNLAACSRSASPNDQLITAARIGDIAAVRGLIAQGADVNAPENVRGEGRPALFHAASEGHGEIAEVLIKAGAKVDEQPRGRATALCTAAFLGHKRVVEILLAAGANVNASKEGGWSPLIEASRQGHTDVVRLLLAHGADVNGKVVDGNTAMSWARTKGHRDIVELLSKSGASG